MQHKQSPVLVHQFVSHSTVSAVTSRQSSMHIVDDIIHFLKNNIVSYCFILYSSLAHITHDFQDIVQF